MNETYERWLARVDDPELREELLSIKGDEEQIRDRRSRSATGFTASSASARRACAACSARGQTG